MQKLLASGVVLATLQLALVSSLWGQSKATYGNDDLRTGWYPNQTVLNPPTVSGSSFGKIFDTAVVGQVYAQPLVSENNLLVATQQNWIYGLNPLSGKVNWSRYLGTPWNTYDYGCSDLTPYLGISSTPVIDETTHIAYLLQKTYVNGNTGPGAYWMHAVDMNTGAEAPNFPVMIAGPAQNDPATSFNATTAMNRASLLLMNGVVYAGFGSMCDIFPFHGWIVGVSTTGQVKNLWTTSPNGNNGGGIWEAGSGLMSDAPGRMFFTTGNGYASTPNVTASSGSVPGSLSQSLVRMAVRADGSIQPDNFFSPYDSPSLDGWDADLGSGGVTGLPDAYFGTPTYPHLMVQSGKQGYVYLMNRDDLGGQRMGPGGGDAVLGRIGPYGSVWSRPGVWPGDGGHVFLVSAASSNNASPTAGQLHVYRYGLDGTGRPALSLEALSNEQFGSFSSSPVITSEGVTSGSALVWLIQCPDASGNNAQLMAYDATPMSGQLTLRYSAPVGQATKFTPPGVGPSRLYVGTRDGHLLGFGVPATNPLAAPLTQFGSVIAGSSTAATVTLTASTPVTVRSITTNNPDFQVGQIALPSSMLRSDTMAVPLKFSPSQNSLETATLHVDTNLGGLDFSLVGNGIEPTANLESFPSVLSLGGTQLGGMLAGAVTLTNDGGQPLTIQSISTPNAPFSLTGAPPPNTVLAPRQTVTMTVQFSPSTIGNYTSTLEVVSTGGTVEIDLSAAANRPGALSVVGQSLNYGKVGVNSSNALTFSVANTGASPVVFTKSKPPALGQFAAVDGLDEGSTLQPGQSRQIAVAFVPKSAGNFSDTWTLNSNTSSGVTTVTLNGIGVAAQGTLSSSVNSVPGPVSLTAEGTTDWAHWGNSARKQGGPSIIGFNLVGTNNAPTYTDDQRSHNWTNGLNIPQANGDRTGIFVPVVGGGMSLTVPADTTTRTFRVHVGGWNSGGQMRAELSDGSVPAYIDSTPNVANSYYRDYTFTYKAASAGQKLTVTWTMTAGTGNVTLASAALDAPSLNTVGTPTIPTGWVYLVSQNSGKCADVEGISTAPSARLHQWDCVGGNNQKFQFVPVTGGYRINILHSGLQVDVWGGPGGLDDGLPYMQYPFWGGANEIFKLQPMNDGTYEVVASHSNKCMDVEGVSQDNGAYLHQWSCLGAANQKWSLVPVQ